MTVICFTGFVSDGYDDMTEDDERTVFIIGI